MYSLRHSVSLPILVAMLLVASSATAQTGTQTGRSLYGAGNNGRCADCHDDGGGVNAPIIDPQNQAEWRERLIPGGIRQLQKNISSGKDETGSPLSSHPPCPDFRVYTGVVTANHCNRVIVHMLKQVGIPVNRRIGSTLFSLDLEGIEFSFNPAITEYTINVEHDIASTTVTAVPNSAFASIIGLAINGVSMNIAGRPFHLEIGITLATGMNTVEVEIAPQNSGKSTTYDINIVRAGSSDATLSSLEIEDIDFTFNPTTTTYNLEVANDVGTQKRIMAMVNDPAARITNFKAISRTTNINRDIGMTTLNRMFPLNTAENLVQLEVAAEDGSVENYFITIYKLTTIEQTDKLSGEQLYSQVSCKNCHSPSSSSVCSNNFDPITGETWGC